MLSRKLNENLLDTGYNVYFGIVDDIDLPAVVFTIDSTDAFNTLSGALSDRMSSVTITCMSPSYEDADDMKNNIIDRMNHVLGDNVAGVVLTGISHGIEYDTDTDSDRYYYCNVSYNIYYTE